MHNELLRTGVISITSAIVLNIDKEDYYSNHWKTEVEDEGYLWLHIGSGIDDRDLNMPQSFFSFVFFNIGYLMICASVYKYVEMLRLGCYVILFYNS